MSTTQLCTGNGKKKKTCALIMLYALKSNKTFLCIFFYLPWKWGYLFEGFICTSCFSKFYTQKRFSILQTESFFCKKFLQLKQRMWDPYFWNPLFHRILSIKFYTAREKQEHQDFSNHPLDEISCFKKKRKKLSIGFPCGAAAVQNNIQTCEEI